MPVKLRTAMFVLPQNNPTPKTSGSSISFTEAFKEKHIIYVETTDVLKQTASNRACWITGSYDIQTDYELKTPLTGVVRPVRSPGQRILHSGIIMF